MSTEAPASSSSRRQAVANTTSSRTSAPAVAAPRPPCTIHTSAIVSDKATIVGTQAVSIAESSVIHPFAKIDSTALRVQVGRNCIIAERAVVGSADQILVAGADDACVELEDYVSIETGATVSARRIGRGSVVEVNAVVGFGAELGKFCKISSGCSVKPYEHLPDYSIIYGHDERRIDITTRDREDIRDLKLKGQSLHVDTLRKLIPSSIVKWQT